MIEGAAIHPLRRIPDERGSVMHMLRRDDPHFREFGEIYFSTAYPGVVKGWHLHRVMTLNYAVVTGTIKLVLFDPREGSPTHGHIDEIVMGTENYVLATVPPGVWNAWRALGTERAIVANCATHPHDPEEIISKDLDSADIPYAWKGVWRRRVGRP